MTRCVLSIVQVRYLVDRLLMAHVIRLTLWLHPWQITKISRWLYWCNVEETSVFHLWYARALKYELYTAKYKEISNISSSSDPNNLCTRARFEQGDRHLCARLLKHSNPSPVCVKRTSITTIFGMF
jgi:hypothetical protein